MQLSITKPDILIILNHLHTFNCSLPIRDILYSSSHRQPLANDSYHSLTVTNDIIIPVLQTNTFIKYHMYVIMIFYNYITPLGFVTLTLQIRSHFTSWHFTLRGDSFHTTDDRFLWDNTKFIRIIISPSTPSLIRPHYFIS